MKWEETVFGIKTTKKGIATSNEEIKSHQDLEIRTPVQHLNTEVDPDLYNGRGVGSVKGKGEDCDMKGEKTDMKNRRNNS